MHRKLINPLLIVTCLTVLCSHDMFLKLKSFYLTPNSEAFVYLYNGTFDKSENVIDRDRMKDVSVVNPGGKISHPATDAWTEKNLQTILKIKTGNEGTGVVGVSTNPKMIELSAEDFKEYLKHDGILDVLEARKKSGEETKSAREKYSKHVKTFIQIGNRLSDDYKTNLGYPIEFIPQSNPYSLELGDELTVMLLRKGKPLKNELVYASYAGYHDHDDMGGHMEAVKTRTDEKGLAKIKISKTGQWYLRTIHMEKSKEENVDYESNWATITFEVR